MVSYNQNLGVWQVNGRGAYATQAEAEAAGGAPQTPTNNTDTFGAERPTAQPSSAIGPGPRTPSPVGARPPAPAVTVSATAAPPVQKPYDPNDQPNPNNPGGLSNNALKLRQLQNAQVAATDPARVRPEVRDNFSWDEAQGNAPGTAAAAGFGRGAGSTRGLPASPAEAGVAPPQQVTQDPGAGVPSSVGGPPPMATLDRTQYDEAAAGLQQARSDFYDQLTRLSGVDPFGNQAFLQKATDRAVSQAAGTAAMARGGAAAIAGAQRQAAGIQSQLAARGTQEVAEQGRRDAVQAAGMRIETVKGIGDVSQQLASNEIALADQATKVAEQNLRAYLGGRELDQAERDSLRRLATAVSQIDMERYKTDVGYRESVNNNLTAMYQSDNALKAAREQIAAGENLSDDEFFMGILGMGAGLASSLVTSDRRQKHSFRAAKTSELKEYLTAAPGSHYRYRNPKAPGQREGDNFGPMAQDLAKTKIGRTVVVEKADGLYVDSARLALADHAALTHLAQRVERLAARISRKTSK